MSLSSKVEIVQSGDTGRGMVGTITLEAVVAENFPRLHPSKDVLHPCTDLLVSPFALQLPARQFPAGMAVRHDSPGPWIAAISHHGSPADRCLGPRFLPCHAVVPVAWQGPTDHNDQAGVGIDDDLVIGEYR